jgi:hypothetical protein
MEDTLQENRFFTIIGGGEHRICNVLFDYKAAYSQVSQDQPYYNKYTFNSLPGTINGTITYNNRGNQGDSPTINFNNLTGQNDPHNFTFSNSVNQSFHSTDGIFSFQTDVKIPIPIGDNPGLFQLGASARVRHRSFDQTYTGRTANDPSGTSNSLFLDQVLNDQFATIYSHRYRVGPQISTGIESVLAHNPQIRPQWMRPFLIGRGHGQRMRTYTRALRRIRLRSVNSLSREGCGSKGRIYPLIIIKEFLIPPAL